MPFFPSELARPVWIVILSLFAAGAPFDYLSPGFVFVIKHTLFSGAGFDATKRGLLPGKNLQRLKAHISSSGSGILPLRPAVPVPLTVRRKQGCLHGLPFPGYKDCLLWPY